MDDGEKVRVARGRPAMAALIVAGVAAAQGEANRIRCNTGPPTARRGTAHNDAIRGSGVRHDVLCKDRKAGATVVHKKPGGGVSG